MNITRTSSGSACTGHTQRRHWHMNYMFGTLSWSTRMCCSHTQAGPHAPPFLLRSKTNTADFIECCAGLCSCRQVWALRGIRLEQGQIVTLAPHKSVTAQHTCWQCTRRELPPVQCLLGVSKDSPIWQHRPPTSSKHCRDQVGTGPSTQKFHDDHIDMA